VRQRAVGKSGLVVSLVALGASNFGGRLDSSAARSVIGKALDLGVTLFDTAEAYAKGRSEQLLGEVLGSNRKDVVIATKWGNFNHGGWSAEPATDIRGGSRAYIMKAVEESLRRLNTDYIDLYQLHMPDDRTPVAETLTALDSLIRQGKIRYAGVSNMPAWQIVEAQLVARQLGCQELVSFQAPYSLLSLDVEDTHIPAAQRYGLGLLAYQPLAEGLLTGKYRHDGPVPEGSRLATWPRMRQRSVNDANWEKVAILAASAERSGHSLLEIAMSWLAAKEAVSSIIVGATTPAQVEQNIAAALAPVPDEVLADIDRLIRPGGKETMRGQQRP